MDIGSWRAIVHGVAKSWTRLRDSAYTHTHTHIHTHTHMILVEAQVCLQQECSRWALNREATPPLSEIQLLGFHSQEPRHWDLCSVEILAEIPLPTPSWEEHGRQNMTGPESLRRNLAYNQFI